MKKNNQINASILIVFLVSGIFAVFTLLSLNIFSVHLSFIQENYFYSFFFVFSTIVASINFLIDSVFIAYRSAINILIKTILQGFIKLMLPFTLIFMGGFGIFTSLSLGVFLSLMYGYGVLYGWHNVKFRPSLHIGTVKKIASFSLGTYIAGLASSIPSFLLPIIITNRIGPTETAYYFIAATTVNILYMIPQAITQNLLVEGSYNEEDIKLHTRKASRFILSILLPSIIVMVLFGNYILLVFGKQYSSEGITLLKLLAISGIFVGVNYVLGTLLILFKYIRILMFINIITSCIILISSLYLLKYGIAGIGYATLFSQICLTAIYIITFLVIRKIYLLRFLF